MIHATHACPGMYYTAMLIYTSMVRAPQTITQTQKQRCMQADKQTNKQTKKTNKHPYLFLLLCFLFINK
jgi:galactokinase/mevalonate kinase-like predicted kinase